MTDNVPTSVVPDDWYQQLMARIDALSAQSVPAIGQPRNPPFWYPDMKGFLAIGIVVIITLIVAALIWGWAPTDDKILTLLTTMVGALLVIFKDVYQYTFGTSAGSTAKDETIKQQLSIAQEDKK